MAPQRTRSGQRVRAERPLDPAAVALWDRIADAKERVAAATMLYGGDADRLARAHERAELTWSEPDPDLQAAAVRELRAFVEALGGRLELGEQEPGSGPRLTAVFVAGEIRLPPLQLNRGRR